MYPFSNPEIRLNERRQDVLFLIGKGLRNAEIAEQLHITVRTVKWYVSQFLELFDASNRTELAGITRDRATVSLSSAEGGSAKSNGPKKHPGLYLRTVTGSADRPNMKRSNF
ncbi:MAG TPA: helix-turn-helix transcriptional regulator [Bryobacteraceae bacterium]|nr:helix-turn-helix transcriptional regulator [Bryobacteraceae bacterium]